MDNFRHKNFSLGAHRNLILTLCPLHRSSQPPPPPELSRRILIILVFRRLVLVSHIPIFDNWFRLLIIYIVANLLVRLRIVFSLKKNLTKRSAYLAGIVYNP